MVRASLLTKQKEAAAAAAAAAIPVITEVSVQEDRARVQSELQGSMKALTGSPPFDDIPTGNAGRIADAIIQWDEMERGKRISDYIIIRVEYIKHVYDK